MESSARNVMVQAVRSNPAMPGDCQRAMLTIPEPDEASSTGECMCRVIACATKSSRRASAGPHFCTPAMESKQRALSRVYTVSTQLIANLDTSCTGWSAVLQTRVRPCRHSGHPRSLEDSGPSARRTPCGVSDHVYTGYVLFQNFAKAHVHARPLRIIKPGKVVVAARVVRPHFDRFLACAN